MRRDEGDIREEIFPGEDIKPVIKHSIEARFPGWPNISKEGHTTKDSSRGSHSEWRIQGLASGNIASSIELIHRIGRCSTSGLRLGTRTYTIEGRSPRGVESGELRI